MKVLLSDNETAYNTRVASTTRRLEPLQAVLAAYTALGLPAVPTSADLADLWAAPRTFLVRMITGGAPLQMGSFEVDPEEWYSILKKPEGADAFVQFVTKTKATNDQHPDWTERVPVGDAELANGQVVLKQAVKDTMREQSRLYATTQAQMDEWNALQAIATALNTIRTATGQGASFDSIAYLGKALLNKHQATNTSPVKPDPQFVVGTR